MKVSLDSTRSILVKIWGSLTLRRRRLQTVLESSMSKVSNIPEDENEGSPSTSGSLNNAEFSLVANEVVAKVPSDDDEVDDMFHTGTYRDYL